MKNEAPINHHRHPGRSDIPVQFYHKIFDTFLARLDETDDDEEFAQYLELTGQFVPPVSQLMETEARRRDLFLCFLRFLGLCVEPTGHGKMISDGTLYTSGSRRFLLCNLEVKSDFPTGRCAYMQNVGYYAKFIEGLSKENKDIEARTCFPAFLVLLEGTRIMMFASHYILFTLVYLYFILYLFLQLLFTGTYLSVCGAVFTDSICIDRLTATIPLERAAYDHGTLRYTARVLRALVTCVKELDQHYTEFMGAAITPKTVSDGMFPRSVDDIDLRYSRRLIDEKRLWLATMIDGDLERKVVVKYTCRYAMDVHRACAEKGIAPPLRYSRRLGYGWIMVVMDYLDDYHSLFDLQKKQRLSEDVKRSIHARLKTLHEARFVHGDMRSPNILLGPDGDVKFIDFDWSGCIGDARYPTSMNPQINWHPDVGLGKPIETEHDFYLVDEAFSEFRQPISPLNTQRFCEWDLKYGAQPDSQRDERQFCQWDSRYGK